MGPRDRPTYDLDAVQALIRSGSFRITWRAITEGARIGFSEEAIVECVLELTPECFHKTMPATRQPGSWQDVYRPKVGVQTLYVKLQIRPGGQRVVVIQFKRR